MLPEVLSLAESATLWWRWNRLGIPVAEVIVNRSFRMPCVSDLRPLGQMSGRVIDRIPANVWARSGRFDSSAAVVNRRVDELAKIRKVLVGPDTRKGCSTLPLARIALRRGRPTRCRVRSWGLARSCGGATPAWRLAAPESIGAFDGARILLFGGKGGVGKTRPRRRLPCGLR